MSRVDLNLINLIYFCGIDDWAGVRDSHDTGCIWSLHVTPWNDYIGYRAANDSEPVGQRAAHTIEAYTSMPVAICTD